VSFASEPGRDDSGLPPVNIVIPDDARELDRDVLAYRREQRARRRRERLLRLFAPFTRGLGGHVAILPLIATCVALSMLAGAMLSVVAISPASAPTVPPQASVGPATIPADLTRLPPGTVELKGKIEPVRSLVSSAIALVPPGCDCGPALRRLASQAVAAHVGLYFAGSGTVIAELKDLAARYGGGAVVTVYDRANVLGAAYHPIGLTVLLVYHDATAQVRRDLPPDFQLGPTLRTLSKPGTGS
jgi:hypothetical protein